MAANSSAQSDSGAGSKPHDENFVIGNDDVLAISVWKEPELTKAVPVRSDGKISLPLVGEMQATGRTPLQLEESITAKLKGFITSPEVTVIVQQVNSRKYNVLGEVVEAGLSFRLQPQRRSWMRLQRRAVSRISPRNPACMFCARDLMVARPG